jgi:hypothetical protein
MGIIFRHRNFVLNKQPVEAGVLRQVNISKTNSKSTQPMNAQKERGNGNALATHAVAINPDLVPCQNSIHHPSEELKIE